MARGIGIALRGAGKALGKQLKKAPALGKYAKAGAARGMRGQTVAEKYKKALGPIPKGVKAPKIPSIKKTTRDIGKGAIIAGVAYAAGKAKAKKEAKAEEKKGKLTRSVKEHKKKTKEQKEKQKK